MFDTPCHNRETNRGKQYAQGDLSQWEVSLMIEFGAGIHDPLLTNAELEREPVSSKSCRPCVAATFAAICREHLWKLHLVTRANVMAGAVVTPALSALITASSQ